MHKFTLLLLVLSLLGAQQHPYISDDLIDAIEHKYDTFAKNRFLALNATLEALRHKSEREQLEGVNAFYNNTPYLSDKKNYNQSDYWATPLEFLGRDRGDCEDYVIAKYFALKYLGIPTQKLYFTYVKSLKFHQAHMVLTYFKTPDSIPLVLDNYNLKIFPANERRDLIPIYNFNADALYLAQKQGEHGKSITHTKTHKKWDMLLQNIKRNKL